jgi:16S rRNA C967 or C1407 C5-methylase (RsmB/RsmF family)
VLDLCATPEGKATRMASPIRDQGLLVANDVHSRRAQVLSENLERWGTTSAAVLNETPHSLARHFPAFFDRVLEDTPCSGEGCFVAAFEIVEPPHYPGFDHGHPDWVETTGASGAPLAL